MYIVILIAYSSSLIMDSTSLSYLIIIAISAVLLVIAALAAYSFGRNKQAVLTASLAREKDMLLQQLKEERETAIRQTAMLKQEAQAQLEQSKQEAAQTLASTKDDFNRRLEQAKQEAQMLLEQNKQEAQSLLDQSKQDAQILLEQNKQEAQTLLERTRREAQNQLEQIKAEATELQRLAETRHTEEKKAQSEQYVQQMKALQEQQKQQMDAFREQLEHATRKLLEERQTELEKENSVQMDAILTPLKNNLAEMRKAFEENKESNHRNSASFEAQIKAMMERSARLGDEAKLLSEALKNKGKVQGDWGEQLLATILDNSGLREGEEYEIQENVKDEHGNNLRPDVIVHCSDGRNVVIDSKVSLTGFYNYVNASTEEERQQAERDNLNSVKSHIKELVDKNYSKLVPNAVPTVLMFIPNEGSYILAMQKDSNLANDAFRKGVLLINPTNLMLALTLIYQLWKAEHREDDNRKIVDAATALYDKFCTFAETFESLGSQLRTVQNSYDKARKQLNEGNGNIIKRLDSLQNLGIVTPKKIPARLREE